MKYCTNCGESVVNSGDAFCANCRHALQTEKTPTEHTPAAEAPEPESTAAPADTAEPVAVPEPPQLTPITTDATALHTDEPAEEPAAAPASEPQPAPEAESAPEPQTAAPVAEPAPMPEFMTEPEEGEPAPKRNRILIIGGAVGAFALIAALVTLFVSGAFASPVDRFQEIQRRAIFEPLAEAFTAVDEQDSFSTDLTITAAIGADDFMMAMISSALEQFVIEIGMDFDGESGESMLGVNFSAFGEEFISAAFTATEEAVGLYIPTLDHHYSMDLQSLLELMGDDFVEVMETQMNWTGTEYGELIQRYGDIILSAVHSDNLEAVREPVSLFDGREEINAMVYTFTPSEADLYDLLAALIQEVRYDDVIFTFFAQQQNEWMLDWLGYDSPRDYWDSLLDDAEDELEELAAEMARANFTWRSALAGTQLVLQEISFEEDGAEFVLRYEGFAARGGGRTDWVTITFDYSDAGLFIRYEGVADSDGGRTDSFTLDLDGDLNDSFSIQYESISDDDGRTDALTIQWHDWWSGENTLSLSHDATRDGDSLHGTLSGFLRNDRAMGSGEFALISYDMDLGTKSILGIPYGIYELEVFDSGTPLFQLSFAVSEGRDGGTDHVLSIYGVEDMGVSSVSINIHSTDEPSALQWPTQNPVDLSGRSQRELEDLLEDILFDLERHFGSLMDAFSLF